MSKRRRQQLLQGGGLLFLSLTMMATAPFLMSMVGGEELVGGAVARASAKASEEEAVLSRTATTTARAGENPLKRKSVDLGHSAEGGGGGGELRKQASGYVEGQERLAKQLQTKRLKVMGRKLQHSETFFDIHNALWRRSVGFGQITRDELQKVAMFTNGFIDKQIAYLQRYESLETDVTALEKAQLIRADFLHQRIDTGWLGDPVSSEELQKWPFPEKKTSLLAKGGGGGGGGGSGAGGGGGGGGGLSKSTSIPVMMNEGQRQLFDAMSPDEARQLYSELQPFYSRTREDVLSSMPEELKKLHSELSVIYPNVRDVPILFQSDLELSYLEKYNQTHRVLGFYNPRNRFIKLNRNAILSSKEFSLTTVLRHEVAHLVELD